MPQSCTSDWSLPSASQNSASGGTMHQKAVHQLDSTSQGMQGARDLLHLRQNATDTKAPMVASGSHDRAQTCKLYPSTRVKDRAEHSVHELTDGVRLRKSREHSKTGNTTEENREDIRIRWSRT